MAAALFDRCELCDDGGCDWTDGAAVYHRECLEARAAEPNNERERRGLANSLRLGSPWPATVKRVDIYGVVEDTFATEGELNGYIASQLPMFGAGEVAGKPKPVDPRQGGLL